MKKLFKKMSELFKRENRNKLFDFCISAALGCFAFALVAEVFLYATSEKAFAPIGNSYCLAIDTSGSMAGDKLDEVKKAAKEFIDKREWNESVALIIYSSVAKIVSEFTLNKDSLKQSIDKLEAYGGTNFEDAMQKTEKLVKDKKQVGVLLFTDGSPSEGNKQKAVDIAYEIRKSPTPKSPPIPIIAVTTADGDENYLECITGKPIKSDDPKRVISAFDGNIGEGFIQAIAVLNKEIPTIIGTGSTSASMKYVRTVVWSMLLCFGIAIALFAAQNKFAGQPLLNGSKLFGVIFGSLFAGGMAGFAGEFSNQILSWIFTYPDKMDTSTTWTVNPAVGQIIGWTILGTLLAFGMTFFIPNMSKSKSLLFGAIGGLLGSFIFLGAGYFVSEIPGRLSGAIILGLFIGLLVSIVEIVFRNMWLQVNRSLRDITTINLGTQLITIGGSETDSVRIDGVAENYASFQIVGDKVEYKISNEIKMLKPGDKENIGGIELVVCSAEVEFAATKFYPIRLNAIK
jgi:Ca-activated chloride channel family protein